MNILNTVFRTLFFYFFIVLAYRIMGKREIGQLGIIDLIISILIAELVAMSIENFNSSIWLTIFPIILLVILEVVLALIATKSRKFRVLIDGKPSIIIIHGRLNYKEMIRQRYTLDDLLLELRQKSIKSIEEVEYAFLENNGHLSIFLFDKKRNSSDYPMPLIVDGRLDRDILYKINKDINWLNKELLEKNLTYKDIFYAFYKKNKLFIIKK